MAVLSCIQSRYFFKTPCWQASYVPERYDKAAYIWVRNQKQNNMPEPDATVPHAAPPAAALRQMIMGFRTTQLIYVAAKLRIADQLRSGPQHSDTLAQRSGADPQSLYRLLRALASIGIFKETGDGLFHVTPLAELLQTGVSGSLHAIALLYGDAWCWSAYGNMFHSITTGEPAFPHFHGQPFFEYLNQHAQAAEIFNKAMTAFSDQEIDAILQAYDFSDVSTIVDIGGGHGYLITAILKANKEAQGLLFEQAPVLDGARNFITSMELEARCELISGDFFNAVPAGGDCYILKSVIHDWDDENASRILKNCRTAMTNNARLLLIERVVPAGDEPSEAKLFDINMLVMLGGCERTAEQYEHLLQGAGLHITNIIATSSALSIVEAVPQER